MPDAAFPHVQKMAREMEDGPARSIIRDLLHRLDRARALIKRTVDELAHLNAHGPGCESWRHRETCETCEQTDIPDEHCTCWLALRRDLLVALEPR